MADFNDLAWRRLMAALMLLFIAVFVSAGLRPLARWRRPLVIAAIALFAVAVAAALVKIGLWLAAGGP